MPAHGRARCPSSYIWEHLLQPVAQDEPGGLWDGSELPEVTPSPRQWGQTSGHCSTHSTLRSQMLAELTASSASLGMKLFCIGAAGSGDQQLTGGTQPLCFIPWSENLPVPQPLPLGTCPWGTRGYRTVKPAPVPFSFSCHQRLGQSPWPEPGSAAATGPSRSHAHPQPWGAAGTRLLPASPSSSLGL